MTLFGIDRLLADPELRRPLEEKRVALLAHPASVTKDLTHSLDALVAAGLNVSAVFGPQHGVRGDLQDNMMESPDYTDPTYGVPVFSLYGEVRRPSGQSMGTFDTILVDLQDLGCRIYTYVTTLLYVLEAAAGHGKSVWVLDRPNPAGRPIEGLTLRPGWESFVGAGPIPMRHGLTLGELGQWFVDSMKIDVDYRVIEMEGWAPDIEPGRILAEMQAFAPEWLEGCKLREISFEPTFHKHSGQLCHGVHIHAEGPFYDHAAFKPWRLQALAFKAIRRLQPGYALWRDFPYEYEFDKLAIDVINGSPLLREWVDDPTTAASDLDELTIPDERDWEEQRKAYLIY